MAALRHREETGDGQHVDVSLLDVVLFQSNGNPTLAAMGHPLPRLGSQVETAVPVNTFACSDGHVYLAVVLDAHWAPLCEVMGRDDLGTRRVSPPFASGRRTATPSTTSWRGGSPHRPWTSAIRRSAAGLTIAKVNTYDDAVNHPHVIERGMLSDIALEDGSVAPLVSPPVKFSRTPTSIRSAPPALGAHTAELLDELGYDAERRADLAANGVI